MLKKLIDYRKKIRLAIASFEEKSIYLELGEYFLEPELKYIYRNDSETIDFIDWEHSGEYFLFYDLFWWMQNDALNYNFNKKLREEYVYIFILELLYKRILNNSVNIYDNLKVGHNTNLKLVHHKTLN